MKSLTTKDDSILFVAILCLSLTNTLIASAKDVIVFKSGKTASAEIIEYSNGYFTVYLNGEMKKAPVRKISHVNFHHDSTAIESETLAKELTETFSTPPATPTEKAEPPNASPPISAQNVSAYLDVKLLRHGKETHNNWDTDYGSYDRDYTRVQIIDIELRGMGAVVDAKLEWYFVARGLKDKRLRIFDKGSKKVTLNFSSPIEMQVESKPLESSVQSYKLSGIKYQSGSKIEGYIVRVLYSGKIVAISAASKALERIGHSDEALEKISVE